MFSYEIDELLKSKDYVVNMDDYKRITESSQVTYINYNKDHDDFTVSTEDRYSWNFKVNKEI